MYEKFSILYLNEINIKKKFEARNYSCTAKLQGISRNKLLSRRLSGDKPRNVKHPTSIILLACNLQIIHILHSPMFFFPP